MSPNVPLPTAIRPATSRRSRTDVRRAAAALCCVALAAGACGKRGSPLAPIVRIPAAITQIAAARMGSDVYVTVTVPSQNIDASMPADVARIDVYAWTGRIPPPVLRFAELGTVVASIPVVPPEMPDVPVAKPPPGVFDPKGAIQGTMVTVRETLTEDDLVHGPELPADPRRPRNALAPIAPPPTGALKRFYVAIPFSPRGRPGPPATPAEVVLTNPLDPPRAVRAAYTESGVSLAWEPAGGLLGFLLDRPLPAEAAPFDVPMLTAAVPVAGLAPPPADAVVPPGPTTYNVYRELAPDPLAAPGEEIRWMTPPPPPVNAAPLSTFTATDDVEFGRARCYTVRALRGTPPTIVTSEPTAPLCLTPVDVFAPAPPTGLAAVPSEGGISLIWEPGPELDLGGYLVLRREGGDATLRQLTGSPITDARFRDTDVTPGARYTYSVVAVDAQLPLPNVSGESERVEEVAR